VYNISVNQLSIKEKKLMLYQILEWFRSKEQEDGQTLVEYALILVFIAITVIAILTLFGPQLQNIYQQILDAITV